MNRFEFRLARPEDAPKVEAFNQRLAAAGEKYHRLSLDKRFRTMAHREGSPITVEKLFCFDGNEIRAGVSIKRMIFRINGSSEEVAFYVYPLSEGIINPAFGMVGLMIEEEMLRRYRLMYGLGVGTLQSLSTELKRNIGWFVLPVPFHFAVWQAYPFLRNITYLRNRKGLRILLDLVAFSGIGTLSLVLFRRFQQLRKRYPAVRNLTIERFDSWGDWADEVWKTAQDEYSLVGDRSRAALQSLYPEGHEHLIKLRFKTTTTNRPIGWAVITASRLKNHKYFGNMILGAIVDMLAVPDNAYSVVSGALIEARRAKADVIIVIHSDHRWNDAFKRAGMLPGKTKFVLSLSPKLKERLNPMEDHVSRLYFTHGDGHGPTHLWMADYHSSETPFESTASQEELS
jgi:hypothetical protein